MKKNNHTKAEGAVFDRRPTAPPTPDELAGLLARDPIRDEVIPLQSLSLQVLADHYGTAVVLSKGTPHIGKDEITRPLAGAVPEVVLDAFDLLDRLTSVRTLQASIIDDRLADIRVAMVQSLSACMMQAGIIATVIRLRLEGVESEVFARAMQKKHLRPRDKTEIAAAQLLKELDRVKRLKPNATRQAWREQVADAFRVSESTIRRRIRELKISF
jgi:hypothetical protein